MPAPFFGEEFTFTNPDGSPVHVTGWGNQFSAVFETPEGYTVVKDPQTGYFEFARLSDDGAELVPTGARVNVADPVALGLPQHIRPSRAAAKRQAALARDAMGPRTRWETRREQRRRAAAPHTAGEEPDGWASPAAKVGNYVGLCLLIAFPDRAGTISHDEVANFCNQAGYANFGNNGSVSDYYWQVSGGKLRYTNVVAPYYTAQHPESYYTDPNIPYGQRARELITEALTKLKADGFDFSQLSTDSNGYVYALNVFYAGPTMNNWAEGLWPHSSGLADAFVASATKKISDYQITDMGNQLTLRTFCHENGHMVCDFPDLYDYGYESYGGGNYCLMAYGASEVNPVQVCGFLKREAGWGARETVITPGMKYQVAATTNDLLTYPKAGTATEYFVVENREQAGRDAALPVAGLTIWHVDETGSNNNEQMTAASHYECALEQADGKFDLEHKVNPGDANDLFGAPNHTAFGSATMPNSKWWDGTDSGLEITDISAPGMTMTFQTKGKEEEMPSIVGSWPIVGVDWNKAGKVSKAGPFTFNADGSWTYPGGGGRWIQVGTVAAWNFTNAPGLIYTGMVTADAIEGIMGYAKAGSTPGTGSFYALRAPVPASPQEFAATLASLLAAASDTDGDAATKPPAKEHVPAQGVRDVVVGAR